MSSNISKYTIEVSDEHTAEDHDGLSAFLAIRHTLYGIARQMLKDATEAEDVVQNVWLRWHGTDRTRIIDPAAFLATVTRRLCINALSSSRSKRQTLVGEWTFEPVALIEAPDSSISRKDTVNRAVQVLLEKLRPTERAAYILREAFDYSSRHIAEVLKVNEPNVRQLLTRSRKHLRGECRQAITALERRRLSANLCHLIETGDSRELERIVTSDRDRETSQLSVCV